MVRTAVHEFVHWQIGCGHHLSCSIRSVSGPLTQTCVSSHQEIWTQANTTDLDESLNMQRNFDRPNQRISLPTFSTSATPRCQDALFFFVMKRRCHESLTRQERCVHHATLLGPTFSKTASSPRLLERIADILLHGPQTGGGGGSPKRRVEEKLQHRLVIVPKLHFCNCVCVKTLISMTSCFFTPATSAIMLRRLKCARWTTTEGIHRLYAPQQRLGV